VSGDSIRGSKGKKFDSLWVSLSRLVSYLSLPITTLSNYLSLSASLDLLLLPIKKTKQRKSVRLSNE